MSLWLYPISKRSGRTFVLDDGTEVDVSAQNYIKLVKNGRLREDKWWSVTKNFDKVQINDEIFIYTGDRDKGIIGYAIVTNKQGKDRKTWKLRLNHNLDKSEMLYDQSIPAQKVRTWIHFPQGAVYSLQDFETELKQLLPWKPRNKRVEFEKNIVDLAENEIAISEGQRINTSQKARHAIEKYSMTRAKKYFESLGYIVKDVSANYSYDLHCVKDNSELLVEVKGTQTDGKKILLPRNEVKIASNNKGKISLYILHSIKVIEKGTKSEAIGGLQCVINPWDIEMGTLTPLVYEYKISKTELKQNIRTRKKI